jgi:hypothetical protein
MKKASLCALLLWILVGCAITPQPRGIQPHYIAGRPAVFCKVVTPPDPMLMGAWKCIHTKFVPKLGNDELEPIEYWLGKYGDEYGLYFYREKKGGDKIYSGWRQWTIDGNDIHSKTGVRIFTENGKVYYSWKGDKPTEMTPFELKKGQ